MVDLFIIGFSFEVWRFFELETGIPRNSTLRSSFPYLHWTDIRSPRVFFNLHFTLKYLFIYLLNFNYTDLNIQIVDKLTIKINKKKKKSQDLNNWVSLYRIRVFFIKINFLN